MSCGKGLLLFLYVEYCCCWHAYLPSKNNNRSIICDPSDELLTKNKFRNGNPMHIWPDLIDSRDLNVGKALYGLRSAIEIIWRNQHPADCSNSKFLISSGWQGGFGSEVHVLGAGLGLALSLNRVYLLNPFPSSFGKTKYLEREGLIDSFWITNNSFCRNQTKTTLECYYEPLSTCTLADAGIHTESDLRHSTIVKFFDNEVTTSRDGFNISLSTRIVHKINSTKSILYIVSGRRNRHVPYEMKELLNCSPMNPVFYYYWWRAITTAYLLRPTLPTLTKLNSLRTLPLSAEEDYITMYVRRGDKHVEMQLVDLTEFWSAVTLVQIEVVKLRDSSEGRMKDFNITVNSNTGSTRSLSPTLFLASESPAVIKQSELWGKSSGWKILYTTLFDREKVSAHLDHKALKALRKSSAVIHHDLEYLSMLLTLDYATRSHGWVCTLASNYCRIIDELRATVGGKANFPFADLSKETCSSPPCINNYNITSFDWRMRHI